MRENFRTFFAVALPESARQALCREADRLGGPDVDVKWVEAEALHVTLKFLGDVPRTRIPAVIKAAEAAVGGAAPFPLELVGVSLFPRPTKPRVVAVGIDPDGGAQLTRLAGSLDEELGRLEFARERRGFQAHVTLGRVKSSLGLRGLSDAILTAPGRPFARLDVEEVVLYMSELSRSGPTYTPLGHVPLCGDDSFDDRQADATSDGGDYDGEEEGKEEAGE